MARRRHGALPGPASRRPPLRRSCATNQGKFSPPFDDVVLLSAPATVLRHRVARRASNPYGQRPEEQALILRHLHDVEPLLRKTCPADIDASAPLVDVVRQLEAIGDGAGRNPSVMM